MRVPYAIPRSRLLKKAHLRRPIWGGYPRARALAAAYPSVRLDPAALGAPPRVPIQRMGAPPCTWTFLGSLGEDGFSGILLNALPDGGR